MNKYNTFLGAVVTLPLITVFSTHFAINASSFMYFGLGLEMEEFDFYVKTGEQWSLCMLMCAVLTFVQTVNKSTFHPYITNVVYDHKSKNKDLVMKINIYIFLSKFVDYIYGYFAIRILTQEGSLQYVLISLVVEQITSFIFTNYYTSTIYREEDESRPIL